MAGRKSFKSDISFLEKISMGATGTSTVLKDLQTKGHSPIELERGSTSFKIWKNIKIKRIRVPDILCLGCGKRIESRTKTKSEISMSHSLADPERGWNRGLDNEDRIAFVVCRKESDIPTDWLPVGPIQYLRVKDLKKSQQAGDAILTKPKGAQEGFEIRMIWPSVSANYPGMISSLRQKRIQYKRENDGRTITLQLFKKEKSMTPLVKIGEKVLENQVLASVVPITSVFPCEKKVNADYYLRLLSSPAISNRYMAAKALGFTDSPKIVEGLMKKMKDEGEHVYVRLEAAAGLARLGKSVGYTFMKKSLSDEYLQNRLETVIALGEIRYVTSSKLLVKTLLDKNQHAEIRAGAAWSLGELRYKMGIDALISSFEEVDESIRVEAARALAKLAIKYTPQILGEFNKVSPQALAGISWAVSKAGKFSISEISDLLVRDQARHWVAYLIGTQSQDKYIHEIEQLREKDPEVYFAVTVLWKVMTSWIWDMEEY